jgi:histidinol phosphatase-like PHP family hydrolase
MEITLSPEENELLLEIVEQRYRALQEEICRTDHREFKRILRSKEKLLECVLNKLKTTQTVHA